MVQLVHADKSVLFALVVVLVLFVLKVTKAHKRSARECPA